MTAAKFLGSDGVIRRVVLEVSKECDSLLLMGQEELDRLTLADEYTTSIRNYGNHSPNDAALQSMALVFSMI